MGEEDRFCPLQHASPTQPPACPTALATPLTPPLDPALPPLRTPPTPRTPFTTPPPRSEPPPPSPPPPFTPVHHTPARVQHPQQPPPPPPPHIPSLPQSLQLFFPWGWGGGGNPEWSQTPAPHRAGADMQVTVGAGGLSAVVKPTQPGPAPPRVASPLGPANTKWLGAPTAHLYLACTLHQPLMGRSATRCHASFCRSQSPGRWSGRPRTKSGPGPPTPLGALAHAAKRLSCAGTCRSPGSLSSPQA